MQARHVPILLFLCAGCGPVDAVERGRELAASPRLSASPSNVFACATCHAETPAGARQEESRRPPGYTLYGAAARPSYWGRGFFRLFDAVNFCLVEFMRGERLTATDFKGLALLAYLESLAPSPEAEQPLTVVANISAAYLSSLPSGDRDRGKTLYAAACAPCHGESGSGKGRLGPYVSVLPDDTRRVFGAQTAAVIAEKVRHGKFFGIGGNMPFYSLESLSNSELADLLAYLLP